MSEEASNDHNSKKGSDKLSDYACETINCGKPAKLQCPTCIKLGIKHGSHFCSQV